MKVDKIYASQHDLETLLKAHNKLVDLAANMNERLTLLREMDSLINERLTALEKKVGK